ncbi:MAG TPA: sodium:phosphate symporter [Planctomycetaceae bacterium]|nr:sodium:phosphate symporter [Planctomycetaceae bacterium]
MNLTSLVHLVGELIGGLGIFLLGMKFMSEGMQAVAGNSLRRLISTVTGNRFFAIIVGVIVTCIVQSSSITTVMVVGFVNSGVMSLVQAVGVIMGANIGTTITGWILVLKIGKYGLPLLGCSAFVYLFSRKDRWRYYAMGLMGTGMVFFGLELMKDACGIIKETPDFATWFQAFQADSYLGVLKCCMVGCILTTMVQSSSATLGITISLAYQGVISYETAAALVIGENVGTTITALLASLGATTNARRAAYFHVLFNLTGVFWITLVFQWYIQLVQWIIHVDVLKEVMIGGFATFPNTTPAIAATHSIFNIANVVLFIPFVGMLVRVLERIVPSKELKEKPRLTGLDMRMLDNPVLAIEQSKKELERMGDSCEKMLDILSELRQKNSPDSWLSSQLREYEISLDTIQEEITTFMTKLFASALPHDVADEIHRQLRIAHEYESVSDCIDNLERLDEKMSRHGSDVSSNFHNGITELSNCTQSVLKEINTAIRTKQQHALKEFASVMERVRFQIKELRSKQLEELTNAGVPPTVTSIVLSILNGYAHLFSHFENIVEALSGEA